MARNGPHGPGPEKVTPAGLEPEGLGPAVVRHRGWRQPLLPGAGPLARVHPAIAFVAVLVVFAVGVWWGGAAGALLLGLLALAVSGLLAATWPQLSAPDRALRLVVIAVIISIALQRWG